ncbi:predicted protein [Arabidopsis lyrata subsp. lyrata]|uniref:Predicted protein n=1 Tax=Arabidopsis lyrata subsp. lyrata TaxID=81972 RepID=D7KP01_ARALL|nr:predicted protein [Arabidopsis lyrata subsp. lyrata]
MPSSRNYLTLCIMQQTTYCLQLDTKTDFPNKIEDGQGKLLVSVEEASFTSDEHQQQVNNLEENHQAEARDHQDHLFSSHHEPWPMFIAQAGCSITTLTNPSPSPTFY